MDLSVLKAFNKKSADGFHQQKHFIKKVLIGKVTQCPQCNQQLQVQLPDKNKLGHIICAKKCTDIQFEH